MAAPVVNTNLQDWNALARGSRHGELAFAAAKVTSTLSALQSHHAWPHSQNGLRTRFGEQTQAPDMIQFVLNRQNHPCARVGPLPIIRAGRNQGSRRFGCSP
jgi:hypothetical protein